MELSEIREKIDAVDEQLLDLFLQRMDLSDEVAAYKNAHHLPILNKERERAILAKVTEKSGERERYAYHLFSTLFELARSRQAELISAPTKVAAQVRASLEAGTSVFPQTGLVACQGVEGANSQVACDRLLPRGNIVYVKTFQAVVSAVESGLCRFGVLPIENSSTGSISQVYDLLAQYGAYIVGEQTVRVEHCLVALPGACLDGIREVCSHEQGLRQCAEFLKAHPDWRAVPLTLVCVDTVPRPMEMGRSILEHMAKLSGEPLNWTIRLVRSPLMQSFRELRSPYLLMAGNVLNELKDKPGVSVDERMADLAVAVGRTLHPEGTALFVEPGTRLGGTLTAKLRETALEEGLTPVAPCPHLGPCPLLETRERRWCHASQLAVAPAWLAEWFR